MGIVGLGSVGMEVARKAKCFGMTVTASKRTPSGRPAYVDELLPHTELPGLLGRSDFAVISVPLTPETHHLIGEKELQLMKKEAVLINISRGKVVDEHALIKALKEGWISSAGLDVFDTEPLSKDSELWGMQNVIITPHIAGSTPHYSRRVCDVFLENIKLNMKLNMKLFHEGRPMTNAIDRKTGY